MPYIDGMNPIWKTVDRPGYMGDARDRLARQWDEQYGKGLWRLAWEWGDLILEKAMALQVYEDGYYNFFRYEKPGFMIWISKTASDVYDTAPSNVHSGFDYSIQETPNNHLHDIAVRRAMARMGVGFKGDHLVEIRGVKSEGYRLNPGIVPFHFKPCIYDGEFRNASGKNLWWEPGTIEDFYQRNKVLQVREATEADKADSLVESL